MESNIPLVDLVSQQAEILDEIAPAVERVLTDAAFVGGPEVAAFEREFADFTGVSDCIGVANGTDAIELALRALGVGTGDDVVLPANTFVATAEAVTRAGARPVLVDADDDTLLMDASLVESALSPRTRAVVPVHLFGQPAAVESIAAVVADRDIAVVEDAAQAQGAARWGAPAGSLSRIAATSFYPGKNLGAAGDAGAVTTDDPVLAERVRAMSNHGSTTKYVHDVFGFNSRLDALQAIVLRAKLRRLSRWNTLRAEAAGRYDAMLAEVPGVRLPVTLHGNGHAWHLYVVRVRNRDEVLRTLHDLGVGAGIHYPVPVHLTGAFARLGHRPGDFPIAERAAGQILSLPMYPHITRDQQVRVVEALVAALDRRTTPVGGR